MALGQESSSCGGGKTCVAVHNTRSGVKTLVVVHKTFLLDQWREPDQRAICSTNGENRDYEGDKFQHADCDIVSIVTADQ
jgi:superfamily II DNA or RNA helicase